MTNLVNVSFSLPLSLSLSLSLFPVAPTLEDRTNVKHFVSLHFLNPKTVGMTPWKGDQPVARLLPTQETETQNKRRQTSMPWVGFEPTMPEFERAKTVHCLRPRGHCDQQTCLWVAINTSERFNLISRGLLILKITCQSVSLDLVLSAQDQPIAESRTGKDMVTSMIFNSDEKFALIFTNPSLRPKLWRDIMSLVPKL
jgi:hypothetical protein